MDQSKETDALRAALTDACDLLEGWVLTRCPKRYLAEHMQHIRGLRSTAQPQLVDGVLTVTGVIVVWHHVTGGVPNDARTVQIYMPGAEGGADHTVSTGWYQPEEGCWYTVAGDPLATGVVVWWAEVTSPPPTAPSTSAGA